jgi:uncharacterized membrane protein
VTPQAPQPTPPQPPVWRGAPQPGAPAPQGYAAPGQGAPSGQPPAYGTPQQGYAAPQQAPGQQAYQAPGQQGYQQASGQQGYQQTPGQQSYQQAPGQGFAPGPQAAYGGPSDWAADAQQNKVWGILAYILFLIPLIGGPKNSPYTRYHTNQGLSFFIVWVVIVIVLNIVSAIVTAVMFSGGGLGLLYGYGWGGLVIFSILGTILGILFAIIGIIGIVHAVKGERKPLPIVGKINILKVQ